MSPHFFAWVQNAASGKLQAQTEDGYVMGMMPDPVDLSHLKGKSIFPRRLGLPATYDLRPLNKLTAIRNQGSCGSCWTFATYGCMESCLKPGETWDFSENNLKDLHTFDTDCCFGGCRLMATAYFARWAGPVNETDDPYNAGSCTSPAGKTVRKHVQDIIYIPDRTGPLDNANYKQAVIDYGAVYTSMNWDSRFYNASTYGYFFGGTPTGNHAICIVGWDDNFSRTKFVSTPAGDGAFLIRNSWGTGWGNAGYFWISYYDTNLGIDSCVYAGTEANTNFNRIYQYDPLGWVSSIGYDSPTAWGANVFTATGDDVISAVSFYTASANCPYEIHGYINPTTGPIGTGGPVLLQTGTIATPGYHTVRLTQQARVTTGRKFSVVLKLTTPGYNYPIAHEYPERGYSWKATANPGESFISPDGLNWADTTACYANSNVCLKAFTNTAGSIRVRPTGNDSNNGSTWALAKKTIQAALNAAGSDSMVWVAAGTYVETVTLKDRVALYGGFAGTETATNQRNSVTNVTIIDANRVGCVVTAPATITAAAEIDGFTLRNGRGALGAGINCAGSPIIGNIVITGSIASQNGGGLYLASTSTTPISGLTVTGNTATGSGGGIYCDGCSPTITNCVITSNTATSGSGGGIAGQNSSMTVTGCTVNSNTAALFGGGISLVSGTPTISNSTVSLNRAPNAGGICFNGSTVALTGNTLSSNGATGGSGGGIYANNAAVVMTTNALSSNTATANGGGAYLYGSTASIQSNTFTGNTASSAGGGIDWVSASPVVMYNTLSLNHAANGAAMACSVGGGTVAMNIVVKNTATGNGGGLYASHADPAICNNTFSENTASAGGGAITSDTAGMAISNNIMAFGSSGAQGIGTNTSVLSNNCYFGNPDYDTLGLPAGANEINSDPMFVNRTTGNYHLQETSLCREAGLDATIQAGWLDIDGEPRLMGLHVDIGADEFKVLDYSSMTGFVRHNTWNLISLPADPVSPDPRVVFAEIDVENASLQYWRNDTGGYQLYGSTFAWTGPLVRGIPYWLLEPDASDDKEIHYLGTPPTTDFVLTIPAHSGAPFWIMFGTPFPDPVMTSNLRFRNVALRGDNWLSWDDAYSTSNSSLRMVEANAQGWNALLGGFITVAAPSSVGRYQLDPWMGYWMLVHDAREMQIKFPKP